MTGLVRFEFEGKPLRATPDGLFVAAEVCDHLCVVNHRHALKRLDDDEKGVVLSDTPGGVQRIAAVNEAGLYSLALSSRKPEAKRFKRWVTHEVLPALRKTGKYAIKRVGGGRRSKNGPDAPPTPSTTFKLSMRDKNTIDDLAVLHGLTKTGVIETAVRFFAKHSAEEMRRRAQAQFDQTIKQIAKLEAGTSETKDSE